jgi:hypothetical protein
MAHGSRWWFQSELLNCQMDHPIFQGLRGKLIHPVFFNGFSHLVLCLLHGNFTLSCGTWIICICLVYYHYYFFFLLLLHLLLLLLVLLYIHIYIYIYIHRHIQTLYRCIEHCHFWQLSTRNTFPRVPYHPNMGDLVSDRFNHPDFEMSHVT